MHRRAIATIGLLLALGLAGCGGDASLDQTLATVEAVRGGVTLGDSEDALRTARAAAQQRLAVSERGLARLSLDSGPQLLLDASTEVEVQDETTVELLSGRLYLEAGEGEEALLSTDAAQLRASDAAFSSELRDGALVVYVVRGEVSWRLGEERGIAISGEELRLSGEVAEATPVTLWHDWTGGLAQPGPADARGPAGVGLLEARVPDEVGQARWPLVIRRLDVQVRIVGDLAVTEVEQVFFNPASETVEGLYRVRVPEAAALQRFAVDRNGHLVDAYVREKAQARQAYEEQVYRGSTLDPALLEWVAPGRYQARIYPIQPGETRRILIRYAEWLAPLAEGGARLYRYPMGAGRRAPRIQEASITVDLAEAGAESVRAGMGAAIEEGRVRLRRSDFAPRSDFWLELSGRDLGQRAWRAPHEPPPRAPDARDMPGEADEHDYYYLPLRLPDALFEAAEAGGVDLVIVADSSAATDRAHLELGRSVAEALTAHLDEDDRVAVVTSDLTIRSLEDGETQLLSASTARVEALLDGLARVPAGGATDLGAALSAAASLLESSDRPGAVIYVGDGAPTVGELEAEGLLERLARLPEPVRLYAVAVGADANLDLLEALTRGGGLALRVEERSAAADASLRLLSHVSRPVAQRVTVDVGTGVENVYPRRPVDVVQGETLSVVGRIREMVPSEVVVRGEIGGVEFEETIFVTTHSTEDTTDLRLRWAGERLRQLLLDGALREEVAELGTRYGLITPFTSFYVPSAQELNQYGANALPWIDRPSLLASLDRERNVFRNGPVSLLLGPALLMGCADSDSDSEAPGAYSEEVMPEWLEAEETAAEMAPEEEGRFYDEEAQMAAAVEEPTEVSPTMPMPSSSPVGAPSAGSVATPTTELSRDGERGAARRMRPAEAPPADSSAFGLASRSGRSDMANAREAEEAVAGPPRRRSRARASGAQQPSSGIDDLLAGELDRNELRGAIAVLGDAEGAENEEERAGNITVTVTTRPDGYFDARSGHAAQQAQHALRRCSDASDLSLDDRRALWEERLGQQGSASGWVTVYRQAQRDCELRTWRDRRTLLAAILRVAGSVQRMIDAYRLFDSGSARGFMRAAILGRVRSPDDLRAARGAFGLGHEPDWELVEQLLERARGEDGRIRVLRALTMQYPDSFDLKLRLLEALEVGERGPEARRLADRMRADPRSDAGVRTAVGEMFLRMGMEEEARRVFSEIVEFAPLDELARRRLGDLYRAHGWFEDAYRQYQTLASIRPDDPTALLLLAQAAAGTGRVDEALRLEQRLMETAQPGAATGIARIAQLWTSVRLAKLRQRARAEDDGARLSALARRMRRSGVLRESGDLRVALTWSHPDAQLSLLTAHPGQSLARPTEIAPEFGIESFDVPEQEDGAYRFEVQRADADSPTDLTAEVVVIWHEGQDDEVIHVLPLEFAEGRERFAWRVAGHELTAL